MANLLPLAQEESFNEVTHQGKTIKVGDKVIVREAGEEKFIEVTILIKKQEHYWVGYDNNRHFYPWPLVQLAPTDKPPAGGKL